MDKGKLKKLNAYHVIFLVQNTMVGLAHLSLSHSMSEMGHDEWMLPIIFGIIVQLTLFPMVWICQIYPNDSLFNINEKLLGKFLGKLVNVLMISYFIIPIATTSNGYLQLVQTTILPNKTKTIPTILLFLVMIYIVNGGIKSVARFCILAFFITVWMLFYLQWPFVKGDIGQIFPLFHFTIPEMASAFNKGLYSMLGYELLLIYFPYIIYQNKVIKHASIGIWITVALYTSVMLASVAYFSQWQRENLLYPVLNLYKSVELSWIERIENVGISIWVFLILSTTAAYLWAAKKGIDSLVNKNRQRHLYIAALIAIGVALGPLSDEFKSILFKHVSNYASYGIMLWPIVLLLVHKIKNRKRREGVA